jgi:hypothetical protein
VSGPIEEGNLTGGNGALDYLVGGLREAKDLFEGGDRGGREGAIHALETVIKFLGCFRPVLDDGLHAPLVTLLDGLLSLDDGAVAPLLKRSPQPGRPRAGGLRESIIGSAVFAVDRLHAAGMRPRQAEEFVAEVLTAGGLTAARGRFPEITADTVHVWRDKVAIDNEANGEAARTFKDLQEGWPSLPADIDVRVVQDFFRNQLAYMVRITQSNS